MISLLLAASTFAFLAIGQDSHFTKAEEIQNSRDWEAFRSNKQQILFRKELVVSINQEQLVSAHQLASRLENAVRHLHIDPQFAGYENYHGIENGFTISRHDDKITVSKNGARSTFKVYAGSHFGFSDDGKRLYLVDVKSIRVFDIQANRLTKTLEVESDVRPSARDNDLIEIRPNVVLFRVGGKAHITYAICTVSSRQIKQLSLSIPEDQLIEWFHPGPTLLNIAAGKAILARIEGQWFRVDL